MSLPSPATAHLRVENETYAGGDLVADRYRLTARIGRGGMGSVWLAHDIATNSDVAVKLVRRRVADDDETALRLLNEARAISRLTHPSLVKAHDFGETDTGDPYVVMDLLVGQSLHGLLRKRRLVSPVYAARLLLPIVHGLQAVHSHGIIHRDIKPDHIILVQEGSTTVSPKLVDFGIALVPHEQLELNGGGIVMSKRQRKRLTGEGYVIGCVEYMSPEQAAGDPGIDHRTDLWSLSVVLYQTLTGHLPFADEDSDALLYKMLIQEPRPISDWGVHDDKMWKIVSRGLQKLRTKRWNSARDLGMAMALWLLEQGVTTDISDQSLEEQWLRPDRKIGSRRTAPAPSADGETPPRRGTLESHVAAAREILIVDDEDLAVRVAARVLEHAGYQVRTASDGLAALHACIASDEPPDLLLADLHMPKLNGVDLATELSRHYGPSAPPVVIMTSDTAAARVVRGIAAVLFKPVPSWQLIETINAVMPISRGD